MLPTTTQTAWNKLATLKQVDNTLVRYEIAQSWKRCLAFDLNPHCCANHAFIHDTTEKREENKLLLKTASTHIQRLYEALPRKGFIIMLLGADGFILSMSGDSSMRNYAESLLVCPGVYDVENIHGTTAPAISLLTRRPAQVLLSEHFFQSYHDWCCSSAPVLDRHGNVLGVLNVANRDIKGHTINVLSTVQMATASIESELRYAALYREHKQTSAYLKTVIASSSEALVFFDKEDKLAHVTKNAQTLLGGDATACVGSCAEAVIPDFPSIKQGLGRGKQWADIVLRQSRSSRAPVEIRLALVSDGNAGEPYGIIGTLRKKTGAQPDTGKYHADLRYDFKDFIYCGKKAASIVFQAQKAASANHTLLIEGESGTGKEILAQSVHKAGSRRSGPFIAVNCAALPKDLVQSELFGYESGSFTGASKTGKAGKLELAHGGTLFLDEIGDMPLDAQANLLRVLQEKKSARIGGARPKHLDVRVIAATNKNLLAESDSGRFRRDLYYRLAVLHIRIPPLRERPEDVWVLAEHFAKKYTEPSFDRTGTIRLSPQIKSALQQYSWPGNVRELENIIVSLINKTPCAAIQKSDLPHRLRCSAPSTAGVENLQTVERDAIQSALIQCGGNISATAELLGISRATMYNKLNRYKLEKNSA